MEFDSAIVAKNLKTLRTAMGLTQIQIADRLGVSSGVITNLEYNRLSDPEKKMPLFRLIAKEFGVDLDWLLNGTGDPVLPDLTEAEKEAELMGQFLASDDPVVRAFLEFWSHRSKAERELLSRQIIEFAEQLKKNME